MKKNKARSIPNNAIDCRDFGHNWKPFDGGRDGRGWFRVMRCNSCKVTRHQKLDRGGDITKQWYDYSDNPDYILTGGRMTKREHSAIRLANMERKHDDD